jgi:pimeloyl-ACP methyl ester carboxylesterase
METVTSKDGTTIAFDRMGDGPPVILVDGAFGHRRFGPNEPLAPLLAEHFTVYTYDRRGRGGSGDTPPYAVEREVEDLDALIGAAGGSASLYGISSGAALALAAAARGLPVTRLALFEAPFVVDDSRPPIPDDYLDRLNQLVAEDRRADAIRLFMTKGVGLPGVVVTMMRLMPAWSKLKAVAHTAPYDAAVLGDTGSGRPLPADRWASVTVPTLVLVGEKSPVWMRNAMRALADTLPHARHQVLPRQTHIVKPKVLAPALVEFLSG